MAITFVHLLTFPIIKKLLVPNARTGFSLIENLYCKPGLLAFAEKVIIFPGKLGAITFGV